MVTQQLRRELTEILGPAGVVSEHLQLRTYECDGLAGYRVVPGLVVLPTTTEQVSAVVRACARARVPFVARGAGSGLSGGALPVSDGVLVVMARMRRILDVDVDNQRITVEPGVTNAEITQAVARHDLYYAPDPSSQVVCTIGGNVAENSGGVHCLKYGFTTNHVLGMTVVLPDGQVVDFGGAAHDMPGYDLRGLMIGSEGTLGIATAVTVRLLRVPEAVETCIAYFDSPRQAGDAVTAITGAGIIPAGMEMMDNLAMQACEKDTGVSLELDAGAALFLEVDGPESEVEHDFKRLLALCDETGATGVRVAEDDDERALIWKGRKAAFAAMGRLAPDYFVQDGVIPRTRLGEVLGRIGELSEETGFRVANVFHAGDGNLHPLVLYDKGQDEEAEQVATRILEMCVEAGGSITGEHGVGADKVCSMPTMFGEEDLAVMNRVRAAFDPKGLCNPGKVIPTPRLCGEKAGKYRPHALEEAGLAERL
jgi:glycolate oxidase